MIEVTHGIQFLKILQIILQDYQLLLWITTKWNNAWDVRAMSNYSTITSISESPIKRRPNLCWH